MHRFTYLPLGIAVGVLAATAVLAEATRPLDALSACRLDDGRVALRFTFEGGACQQPGEPTLEAGEGGVGAVTVPTEKVGDVCTLQILPVEFAGVVDADPSITSLDITVLDTNGGRLGLGSTDVADDADAECIEPEPGPDSEPDAAAAE